MYIGDFLRNFLRNSVEIEIYIVSVAKNVSITPKIHTGLKTCNLYTIPTKIHVNKNFQKRF